jgi:DNA-binding CsgD family transcriptional regulator
LISLGSAALYGGDPDGARASFEESLATSRRVGYREGVAWSLNQLGVAARRAGDLDGAEKLLRESLKVHRDLGDRWRIASVLEALAETACLRQDLERAARLFGAADDLRAEIGAPIPPCERGDRDGGVAAAREGLGEASFAAARGRPATLEEAVAPATRDRPGRASSLPHGLSAREAEVLGLVAEGLTDRQVANRLYLSPRTVGQHLRNVYRKLGVASRTAATRAAIERDLV